MKKFKILLLLVFLFCGKSYSQTWENLVYTDTLKALNTNPVRGLIPGFPSARNFPYSLEFFYIPLRGTMNNINSFNWTTLETNLENIANAGNTAVVRFYLDYPGRNTALPQYLIDAGVAMTAYTDHGNQTGESLSPDYSDQRTVDMILNFIEKFGEKYDGDPRISVVQAGLLGYWGEWHTYPSNNLNITNANRNLVFEKYISSFPKTQLNFRSPNVPLATLTNKMKVGYHDDSFLESTLGPLNWHFLPTIISNNVSTAWQKNMIGGEIYPGLQGTVWNAIPNPNGQRWDSCAIKTHATYMLNQGIFTEPVGTTKYKNALSQNKLLGYSFFINAIKLNVGQNDDFDLDVKVENKGVAPFYYNWKVEFALLSNNVLTNLGTTDWNINTIQPTAVAIKNFNKKVPLQNGTYTVLMRFVNPLTATKANAKQLHFTNKEQNNHKNGWISLKTFEYPQITANSDKIEDSMLLVTFPNPTNATLNVRFTKTIQSIKIFDTNGKLSKTVSTFYNQKEVKIDISELASGTYNLVVESENKLYSKKIIKK